MRMRNSSMKRTLAIVTFSQDGVIFTRVIASNMPSHHNELGQKGEQAAADYLLGLGWRVLERNWRGARGELDIIACEGDTVVIVEVKTRRGTLPEEAFVQVNRRKQTALIMTAEEYLEAHDLGDTAWRVDVIAVIFGRGAPLIEHARDALVW